MIIFLLTLAIAGLAVGGAAVLLDDARKRRNRQLDQKDRRAAAMDDYVAEASLEDLMHARNRLNEQIRRREAAQDREEEAW